MKYTEIKTYCVKFAFRVYVDAQNAEDAEDLAIDNTSNAEFEIESVEEVIE